MAPGCVGSPGKGVGAGGETAGSSRGEEGAACPRATGVQCADCGVQRAVDCAGFPAPSEQGSPHSPGPLGSVLGAALSPFSPPAFPTHSLSELGFPGPANRPFPPLLRPALVDWPPSLSCPSLSSSSPLPSPLPPSLPSSVCSWQVWVCSGKGSEGLCKRCLL